MSRRPHVAVVGGGILGLTAAYRLVKAGVGVDLYEAGRDLGGLVGTFDFDGHRVDRFYHVVLPTDMRVRGLAEEVGLGSRFRFRPTDVGFYDDGRLFSMSSLREFMTFPLLRPLERLRLAAFVARCQTISSCERLDEVPLEEWLRRTCGEGVLNRLWRPLLDSKFDGRFDDLPASYLWARTRRMSKTRDSKGHEIMGWLEGGYETLVDRLATEIRTFGGRIHTGRAVDRIVGSADAVTGVAVDGAFKAYDHVLCTLAPPVARRLLPEGLGERLPQCRYLGVICLVVRTRRSISPYYTLNITDRRIPLTTIVETTHVVDPEYVGGHLLYVSKYVQPDHGDLERPADEVQADYVAHARSIFPQLTDEAIMGASLQRARVVEPVHLLGGARNLPPLSPAAGLTAASTANVYPDNLNGESVIGIADQALAEILASLDIRAGAGRAAA